MTARDMHNMEDAFKRFSNDAPVYFALNISRNSGNAVALPNYLHSNFVP